MPNVKGRVEAVKQNKKNPSSFSILVDEAWYSIYDKSGVCPIKKGDEIDYPYTEKEMGDVVFKNIQLKPVRTPYDKPISVPHPERVEDKTQEDSSLRLIAIDIVKDFSIGRADQSSVDIIASADKIFKWLKTGELPK